MSDASPYNRNYIWSNASGFGTNVSSVTFPDNSSVPGNNLAFNVNATVIGAINGSFFYARRWDGSNFGTAYTNTSPSLSMKTFAFGSVS